MYCISVLFSAERLQADAISLPIRSLSYKIKAGRSTETQDSDRWRPLNRSDIQSVKTFLFFIGWPRSCHSIIGSMLDAHPNAIVAHEYFLFRELKKDRRLLNRRNLYNMLYRNSHKAANGGWRSVSMRGKGYSLDITDSCSWQGRFSELKVIGDKTAGDPTRLYSEHPFQFRRLHQQLRLAVQVPVRVLHVVRNPFDMIATLSLYRGSQTKDTKVNATLTHKYSNPSILREATDYVLKQSRAIAAMVPDARLTTHEVHCEDLIQDPKWTMSRICSFLNMNCSLEFLDMCEEKTFTSVSMSRYLVEWNQDLLLRIAKQMQRFPFFQRYSFESNK